MAQQLPLSQIIKSTAQRFSDQVSPLAELGITYRDQQDLNELNHLLSNILSYPSTELAERHRDSNRLGAFDLNDSNQNKLTFRDLSTLGQGVRFCTCCGFIHQEDPIKLCTNIKEVTNIGLSTYLYFRTITVLLVLLTAMFVIYSIYALITNIIASNNYVIPDHADQTKITNEGILSISLGSKQIDPSHQNIKMYNIQAWLGVAMLVVWSIIFVIAKGRQKLNELRIASQSYSASDYSIIMEGVPTGITEEQMQKYLNDYARDVGLEGTDLKIAKYNIGRPFYLNEQKFEDEDLKELNEQHEKMIKMFAEWVLQRQDKAQFSVDQRKRQEQDMEFDMLKEKRYKAYKFIADNLVKQFEINDQASVNTVFITFETNRAKDIIVSLNKNEISAWIRYYLGKCACCKTKARFYVRNSEGEEKEVTIRQAPEPEDIIWTNLGRTRSDRMKRKLFTYFITFLLLAASFGIVYGLASWQAKVQTKNRVMGFVISLIISIFNVLIQMIIRQLTYYERDYIETNSQASLGLKSVFALLINSILIPILVNYLVKGNLYGINGLAADIIFLSITNSFLSPLLKYFDFYFYFTRLQSKWKNKPASKLYLNQLELNRYAEYIPFDVGYEYIYLINLFLFTCFFVSLQPIIPLFAICGLFLMYWAQKHTVFSRSRRPVPGTNMVNTVMYQLIYLGALFYSMGSMSWSSWFPEGLTNRGLVPNIVAFALSGVIFLLPYETIFDCIYKDHEESPLTYFNDIRIYLPSEYDRLNPATSKTAIKQFLEYLKVYKQRLSTKDENELKRVEQNFMRQIGRGHRQTQVIPNMNIFGKNEARGNENVLQEIFGNSGNTINPLMLGASVLPDSFNMPASRDTNNMIMQIANVQERNWEDALTRQLQSKLVNIADQDIKRTADEDEYEPFTENFYSAANRFSTIFNLDDKSGASPPPNPTFKRRPKNGPNPDSYSMPQPPPANKYQSYFQSDPLNEYYGNNQGNYGRNSPYDYPNPPRNPPPPRGYY